MSLTVHPVAGLRLAPRFALTLPQALRAPAGRVTLIAGDSGSGKSMLLRLLAGDTQELPTPPPAVPATVQIDPDADPVPLDLFLQEPTRLSYLAQQTALRLDLVPGRALADWRDLLTAAYGPDSEVRRFATSIQAALKESLFTEDEQQLLFGPRAPRIRHLSGGQRRRLDVILALSSPAEIVLLDEPDSGLDEFRRRALFEALIDVAATYRKVVVVVSHFALRESPSPAAPLNVWRVSRSPGNDEATVAPADEPAPSSEPLPMHDPPEARGDMRVDQLLIYVRQRLAAGRTRTTAAFLATPLVLMTVVRLAIYPDPIADGPSLALLFFYAVACFWLGTVQATGFWSDEASLFQRECRQGASSFSFLTGCLVYLALLLVAQAGLGALALKYASWPALFSRNWTAVGADLHIGWGRLTFWGVWAGFNGLFTGLAAATVQHRTWPRATHPTTAQMLALLLTLSAIVFSYPIVGSRAYEGVLENVQTPNRLALLREAATNLRQTEAPVPAILLAEAPVGVAPAFQGLWFQGERPRRYGLAPALLDEFQKEAVPVAALNLFWLALLYTLILRLAYRMRLREPAGAAAAR